MPSVHNMSIHRVSDEAVGTPKEHNFTTVVLKYTISAYADLKFDF